jgi:hypothetical protein
MDCRQRPVLPPFLAVTYARNAGDCHESGDAFLPARNTQAQPKFRMNAPGPIGSPRIGVNTNNNFRQDGISDRALRRLTALPGVKPSPRNVQNATRMSDINPGGRQRRDHREDAFGRTFSLAKYADACFKISISAA